MSRQKPKLPADEQSFPKIKSLKVERKRCECMAQKHALINNCLNCGKIICESEGEGPCMFCGNIVHKPETQYVDRNNAELFPTLSEEQLREVNIERSKAIQHKNVLVGRDTNNSVNQNIYDEQTDYYQLSENQWASQQDRKKAVERIINEQKFIKDETQTQKGHYDAVKQQWIRDEFVHDTQGFKKEAQQFIKEAESREIKKKIEKGRDPNAADERLTNNEKALELYNEIKATLCPEVGKKSRKSMHQREYKGIEIVQQ